MTTVAVGTLSTWLTNVRTQLQTELRNTYGGDFDVVHAQLTGPYEDRDIGCVWIAAAEIEAATAQQLIDVRVRVFRQWRAVDAPGLDDLDPTVLEEIPDVVNNALLAIQVSAGLWWFSIQGFEIDHESWGTEVRILARRENPFLT